MTANQETESRDIPPEETERLLESVKGAPALLEDSLIPALEERLRKTGTARRIAFYVATKSFDELKNGILSDRELAVAMADVQRCARDAGEGLSIAYGIVLQSQARILAALSERGDCDEILAEVNGISGGTDADDFPHLEEIIAGFTQEDTYEISITNRVKAIQPKFKSLHDKYIFPGGSQLLTDPKSLGTKMEKLRNEVRELRNRMPIESEEGMDLGLVIDQLDFLIRIINSGFEFKGSDLITVSHLVDQAGSIFGCSLQWLELDEGGNLAEDTRH